MSTSTFRYDTDMTPFGTPTQGKWGSTLGLSPDNSRTPLMRYTGNSYTAMSPRRENSMIAGSAKDYSGGGVGVAAALQAELIELQRYNRTVVEAATSCLRQELKQKEASILELQSKVATMSREMRDKDAAGYMNVATSVHKEVQHKEATIYELHHKMAALVAENQEKDALLCDMRMEVGQCRARLAAAGAYPVPASTLPEEKVEAKPEEAKEEAKPEAKEEAKEEAEEEAEEKEGQAPSRERRASRAMLTGMLIDQAAMQLASSSTSPIEDLEKQLAAKTQQCEALEKKLQKLERSESSLRKELQAASIELEAKDEEKELLKQQGHDAVAAVREQLKQKEFQSADLHAQVKTLTHKLASLDKEVAEEHAKAEQAQKDLLAQKEAELREAQKVEAELEAKPKRKSILGNLMSHKEKPPKVPDTGKAKKELVVRKEFHISSPEVGKVKKGDIVHFTSEKAAHEGSNKRMQIKEPFGWITVHPDFIEITEAHREQAHRAAPPSPEPSAATHEPLSPEASEAPTPVRRKSLIERLGIKKAKDDSSEAPTSPAPSAAATDPSSPSPSPKRKSLVERLGIKKAAKEDAPIAMHPDLMPIEKGMKVKVNVDMKANNPAETPIREGWSGTIQEVDEEEDGRHLLVDFVEHPAESLWIEPKELKKCSILPPDPEKPKKRKSLVDTILRRKPASEKKKKEKK